MNKDKLKKVLIALDYDPTARKVAEAGFLFAKTMHAEIVLLHVITDPAYYISAEHTVVMGFAGYSAPLQIDSIDGLKKASIEFLEKSKNHLGEETIKIMVEEGDIAESILKAAKKIHADIIVLGSHSRKWLENILMGSVTEKVLHNTTIPIFIIPTKKQK